MKKAIFAIAIAGLITLLAFWYLGNTGSAPSDSSLSVAAGSAAGPANSSDAAYIYNLLQEMQQVKSQGNLSDTLFFSPAFVNLHDNTVTFSAPPAGRDNPFAPVGSTGAVSTTTIHVKIK
ncbi:MAG: hypothetical protein KGH93_00270 [Patescibacteria group bacterium]|nr:hypothetical protein [Patescibacteria group bacterium]MDE1945628.1 hypothetical protein [Patescibacteria group bacterium]